MTKNVLCEARRALGGATQQSLSSEMKARHDAAFSVLNAQVEAAKHSAMVQIAAAATIASLLLSGRLISATGLASAWLGSRPLTHMAAGGVACVAVADARLRAAVVRSRQPKLTHEARKNGSAARRWAETALAPVAQ